MSPSVVGVGSYVEVVVVEHVAVHQVVCGRTTLVGRVEEVVVDLGWDINIASQPSWLLRLTVIFAVTFSVHPIPKALLCSEKMLFETVT